MSPISTFQNFASVSSCLKTKVFARKEIVQYLQNCKYQDVNQNHFRKPLQASTNVMEKGYIKTAHIFFTRRSIFTLLFMLKLL